MVFFFFFFFFYPKFLQVIKFDPKIGGMEVKSHPFFDGVDWDNLLHQEAIFIPRPTNPEDTDYFESWNLISKTFFF